MNRPAPGRLIVCIGASVLLFAAPAPATIRYVDAARPSDGTGQTWFSAYRELQSALAAAQAGDEIRVAAGVYRPDYNTTQKKHTGERSMPFMLKDGVVVLGGFPPGGADPAQRDPAHHETILSGDLAGDDAPVIDPATMPDDPTRAENSYCVVYAPLIDAAARLDGFTIRGGQANQAISHQSRYGAGLKLEESELTISNCTFSYNMAGGWGGGLYASRGSATVTDCTFYRNYSGNHGGGFYVSSWSSGTQRFLRCVARENGAAVGGGASVSTSGWLENCTFVNNIATTAAGGVNVAGSVLLSSTLVANSSPEGRGGGVLAAYTTSVIGNLLVGNSARYGGGAVLTETSTLVNCLLSGNTAVEGGAFYAWGPSTILNCTAIGNTASQAGGALRCQDAVSTVVRNSILWNNLAPQGDAISLADSTKPGTLSIGYTCLQGGQAGVTVGSNYALVWAAGNIEADPMLADPDGADDLAGTLDDNLHVSAGSPCLDAGDTLALPADGMDLDVDSDLAEPLPFDAAGHVRLADDENKPDSGPGPSPVVDMGAFEGIGLYLVLHPDTAIALAEGSEQTVEVSLPLNPGGPVKVWVSRESGDADIAVTSGAELTFDASNYLIPQPFVIKAVPDADFLNGSATILVQSPGVPPARIVVTELDAESVPPILYVDAAATGTGSGLSWANAFTELQEAIHAQSLKPGSLEIHVAQGTYRPDYDPVTKTHTQDRQLTFRPPSGLALRGGYAGVAGPDPDASDPTRYETVLSGDLLMDDAVPFKNRFENSMRVVTFENVAASTRLEGFTIRGGYLWSGGGAGILVLTCSPQIRHCRVADHWTYGGALWIDGSPLISDCDFEGNQAYYRYHTVEGDQWVGKGGAALVSKGAPRFVNCVFRNNSGDTHGGAFHNAAGTPTLVNCGFLQNYCAAYPSYYDYEGGGAVYNNGGTLTLVNCILDGNRTRLNGGAVYSHAGTLKMTGCLVSGNISGTSAYYDARGGGAYVEGSVEIKNCTFVENRSSGSTATALYSYRVPILTNDIFWGSQVKPTSTQASLIYVVSGGGKPTIRYSCVEKWSGTWGGVGNIGTAPVVLAEGTWNEQGTTDPMDDVWTPGDYRLAAASPGVDAGENAGVPVDTADADADGNLTEPLPFDLTGNPRFFDNPAVADTGAGTAPIVDMGAYEVVVIPADLDEDGDIDGNDVALLGACATGPMLPYARLPLPEGCTLTPDHDGYLRADLDRDGDVDQLDFAIVQRCLSGETRPDPLCHQ